MTGCPRIESGSVELYFYDELEQVERASMARHLASCGECRQAFDELTTIRAALASRPIVSAPLGEDWTGFMTRLKAAVAIDQRESAAHGSVGRRGGESRPPSLRATARPRRSAFGATAGRSAFDAMAGRSAVSTVAPYLAMAALLALVTMSVAYVARTGWGRERGRTATPATAPVARADVAATASPEAERGTVEAAFAALSEQHFERSKLVVLGLTSKDAQHARLEDWEYERQLASSLLTDTRLYRAAAEERGMTSIANVMRDLELVLLQTSLAAHSGPDDLAQIQRLIDRRDLVTKMELAAGI
jgi:hypothetical protein